MTYLITRKPEDDDEVAGWMAQAGDPRVEPRPEHVERVREVLFERLAVTAPWGARRWLILGRVMAVAAVMLPLIVLGGFILSRLNRPGESWSEITRSVQQKRWIHAVSRNQHGDLTESWSSPRYEIFAVNYEYGPGERSVEYHDLMAGTKTLYVEAEDTIYRVLEAAQGQGHLDRQVELFRQILFSGDLEAAPLPDTEVIEQASRDVTEGGKTWKQHEMTIRWAEGNRPPVKMVIRVDPATGLPRTWDVVSDEGTLRSTLDYRDTGPADILAIGVPATAKRVDRLPARDLDRELAGLRIGRVRFDDYCGYTWSEGLNPADVSRIWRKGSKWRIEKAYPRQVTKDQQQEKDRPPMAVPSDANLEFWKRHEPEMVFEPQAVCDGKTIRIYHYPTAPSEPDQPHRARRSGFDVQHVGAPDDPIMPWPHLMPERIVHPNVDIPSFEREFTLDLRPADGPPGTARISVRDALSRDPKERDLYRLWIDCEKNHLAMRAEISVFEPYGPTSKGGSTTKLPFVDIFTVVDLERSPAGFWYPTRVLRKPSNVQTGQVIRFLLDFDAEIPDALFRAVK